MHIGLCHSARGAVALLYKDDQLQSLWEKANFGTPTTSNPLRNPLTVPITKQNPPRGFFSQCTRNITFWCSHVYLFFYRTTHSSAKRGLEIACRPSVRLSVRLSVTLADCDYIGWKPWKLIARTITPTPSLFVAQRPPTYSRGNMGKFWRD